jgi:hypothetical protein
MQTALARSALIVRYLDYQNATIAIQRNAAVWDNMVVFFVTATEDDDVVVAAGLVEPQPLPTTRCDPDLSSFPIKQRFS